MNRVPVPVHAIGWHFLSCIHLLYILALVVDRLIRRGESKLKNATGWCLAYHTESMKNEYVWQQVGILFGHHYLLLSAIKRPRLSWFGNVCCHDTLPKIILQGSVDGTRRRGSLVNHGWTTSTNRQASRCRHCCASLNDDRSRSAVVAVWASVGVPAIDAWASLVLVSCR